MRQLLLTLIALFFFVSLASADNGLISIKSSHNVKKTGDRLENALKAKGMTVFIRINHAEGAQKVGKKLRPTELIIFGNPKVGTPLMQNSQSAAIDLPQKALIWEDEAGQVWFSYNDPKYIAKRHSITECAEVLKKIENALGNFAKMATMP
ncbi:MAG: DUF302 domain-containing protein [Thermodesulfobacteriota bacterium]|nr:DUF302 domain-containing protein [Thermodesulfobacteriota bacterium]